jgi:hypothetical protein
MASRGLQRFTRANKILSAAQGKLITATFRIAV